MGIALRIALCALCTWVGWRLNGPLGALLLTPLWGIALANPVLDLLSSGRGLAREWALARMRGQDRSFKGRRIRIAQDDFGHSWLLADDVRKVLPQLPRNGALPAALAGGARPLVPGGSLHIQALALDASLRQAQNLQTVAFKRWLEREVIGPAQRQREQAVPQPGSVRRHG